MNHDETISLSNTYIYIYASSIRQFNLLCIRILVINPHYQQNTLNIIQTTFFELLNYTQFR